MPAPATDEPVCSVFKLWSVAVLANGPSGKSPPVNGRESGPKVVSRLQLQWLGVERQYSTPGVERKPAGRALSIA
jgi:hypothetical protein